MLGLLGGTAAAFAVTERLKLVPSPIVAPRVTEAFSPVCACVTAEATISFELRDPDRVTVTVIDDDGDDVETIASDERHPAGRIAFTWSGAGAAEGAYRARVHLDEARRTIVIPNRMQLDTTPPAVTVEAIRPRVFSPDRDGRVDAVHAFFSVSERASVLLYVDGQRAIESPPRQRGKIDWYGGDRPQGVYSLAVGARDLAGNESARSAATSVRLRYLTITPRRVVVPAGVRFGVRVSTDRPSYTWRLGSRSGIARRATLALRAPTQPGRYTLRLSYPGRRAAVPVFVRPRP